uniref:Uncharacterized protein n=1 Tax=Glossina brevipalpis TaxID=37001 RepID=A0A1A9WQ78_9MUSC
MAKTSRMGLRSKGTVREVLKALSVPICSSNPKLVVVKRHEEIEVICMLYTASLQLLQRSSSSKRQT